MGMAALAIDIGRMYVVKSELQAFADAAALTAALELDGTTEGIRHAREAAAGVAKGPHAMKWDLGSKPVEEIATSFGRGDTQPDPKTWEGAPANAGDYHFVRVMASAPAPVIFLRALQPLMTGFSTVAAAGVAVKTPQGARLTQ